MKKRTKSLAIWLSIAVALAAAVLLSVSPAAKYYINAHGEDLIGRRVNIEKLSINLLNTSVSAGGITVYEAGSDSVFFTCGRFSTRLRLFPLLRERFIISRIAVDEASVNIIQQGDRFNFDDMIERFAGDSTESAEPGSWDIGIYNIHLGHSHIFYRDLAVGSRWDMRHISVDVPGFYLSSQSTDVGLQLDFPEGGSLASKIEYDYAEGTYDITLNLRDFAIDGLLPYFRQYMNVSGLKGLLGGQVRITGDTQHVMEFNVSGSGYLKDFALMDDNGREVVSADSASTVIDNINYGKAEYLLSDVTVCGLKSHVEIYADSTNCFSNLMKPSSGEPDETQYKVEITRLALKEGRLLVTDNCPHEQFCYAVGPVEIEGKEIGLDRHCSITARATLQGSGSAHIHWTGNPSDMSNHNVTIELRNVDMTHFSPYTMSMFGYPFAHGTLSYSGQNVIRNNKLQGTNHIDIHNPKLDRKRKDITPQYKVPLRTGVYVLTDRTGRMKMDVPVSGDVDSPQFSYGKIITSAIVNTLVKVVLSPAKYIAESMGLDAGQLEYIDVDPAQGGFTSEQYDKFAQLCNMVRQKPELCLSLTHRLNLKEALPKESLAELKRAYYRRANPAKADMPLEMLDQEAALATDAKSKALTAFADSMLVSAGKPVKGDITAKSQSLFAEAARQKLMDRAAARNALLRSHLTAKMNMADSMLAITLVPPDSMAAYKGRHCYAVGLTMRGDAAYSGPAPEED